MTMDPHGGEPSGSKRDAKTEYETIDDVMEIARARCAQSYEMHGPYELIYRLAEAVKREIKEEQSKHD